MTSTTLSPDDRANNAWREVPTQGMLTVVGVGSKLAPLALLALTCGCFDREDTAAAEASCTSCHGDQNAAPPGALGGRADTLVIGAHQSHLAGTILGRPVACTECHVVPATVDAEGHIDTPWPAEIKWGALSKTNNEVPIWDRETGTCSNTYCHGAAEPDWTLTDGSEAQCGACHGTPPPAPHPASAACVDCHAPVAGPALTIADPMRHLDGIVDLKDVGPSTCGGNCHGNDMNEAPPRDLSGSTSTTSSGVGAHQIHLSGGLNAAPVACTECHIEINAVGDPGHTDTPPPAELVFGPLSTMDGKVPAWDGNSCADSYCHAMGGSDPTPVWTTIDGSQIVCGSCHSMPPAAPHPNSRNCAGCHGATAGPNDTITNKALHINGNVDFN